ncbi:MAG: hypothetical protein WC483_03380 [Candidatus Paceibacterota bacterium]
MRESSRCLWMRMMTADRLLSPRTAEAEASIFVGGSVGGSGGSVIGSVIIERRIGLVFPRPSK